MGDTFFDHALARALALGSGPKRGGNKIPVRSALERSGVPLYKSDVPQVPEPLNPI